MIQLKKNNEKFLEDIARGHTDDTPPHIWRAMLFARRLQLPVGEFNLPMSCEEEYQEGTPRGVRLFTVFEPKYFRGEGSDLICPGEFHYNLCDWMQTYDHSAQGLQGTTLITSGPILSDWPKDLMARDLVRNHISAFSKIWENVAEGESTLPEKAKQLVLSCFKPRYALCYLVDQ